MANLRRFEPQILSSEDRTLFQEAIVSASRGAPRGAYILIWLSCAESLKRKFKEAAIRDGQANRVVGRIQNDEASHKSVDMLILNEAKNYGFIDDATHQKLAHVYDLRCLYGHPYESAPTDSELITAAEVVVREVLSKPAMFKHGFIQSLIDRMFGDINYLENNKTKVKEFASEIAEKIDPSAYSYVVEKYAEKLESAYSDATLQVVVQRGIWFLGAFLEKSGTRFYTATQWHDFLSRFPNVGQYVLTSSQALFTSIGARAKDYIISFLLNEGINRPSLYKRLERMDEGGHLSTPQQTRFRAASVSLAIAADLSVTSCFNSVIEDLKSHNWYRQNPAAQYLRSRVRRSLADLTSEQQESLGRNILQASDGEAGNATELLQNYAQDPTNLPEGIIKGIIFECFVNESSQFRLKTRPIDLALELLKVNQQLIPELVTAIQGSQPRGLITGTEYAAAAAAVTLHPELNTLKQALDADRDRLVATPESDEVSF